MHKFDMIFHQITTRSTIFISILSVRIFIRGVELCALWILLQKCLLFTSLEKIFVVFWCQVLIYSLLGAIWKCVCVCAVLWFLRLFKDIYGDSSFIVGGVANKIQWLTFNTFHVGRLKWSSSNGASCRIVI